MWPKPTFKISVWNRMLTCSKYFGQNIRNIWRVRGIYGYKWYDGGMWVLYIGCHWMLWNLAVTTEMITLLKTYRSNFLDVYVVLTYTNWAIYSLHITSGQFLWYHVCKIKLTCEQFLKLSQKRYPNNFLYSSVLRVRHYRWCHCRLSQNVNIILSSTRGQISRSPWAPFTSMV